MKTIYLFYIAFILVFPNISSDTNIAKWILENWKQKVVFFWYDFDDFMFFLL